MLTVAFLLCSLHLLSAFASPVDQGSQGIQIALNKRSALTGLDGVVDLGLLMQQLVFAAEYVFRSTLEHSR